MPTGYPGCPVVTHLSRAKTSSKGQGVSWVAGSDACEHRVIRGAQVAPILDAKCVGRDQATLRHGCALGLAVVHDSALNPEVPSRKARYPIPAALS